MRHFILLVFCMTAFSAAAQFFAVLPSDIVVVQINAEWNDYHTRTDLEDLKGCDYRFGWLEDQPKKLQETIKSVPVVVIYKDGRPVWQFAADISFKLNTPFEEIQRRVYDVKD